MDPLCKADGSRRARSAARGSDYSMLRSIKASFRGRLATARGAIRLPRMGSLAIEVAGKAALIRQCAGTAAPTQKIWFV